VLPPSMLSTPTAADFTIIPITSSGDVVAYRAHRATQHQQQQVKAETVAAAPTMPTRTATATVVPTAPTVGVPASLPSHAHLSTVGLMSPNTHAAVATLTSVHAALPSMVDPPSVGAAVQQPGIISPTR
jgi:hypothetical protein